MSNIKRIRNFSIIAHIDHGKSTIADRIIHKCGGLTEREMKQQVLDSMDIERERGITIKAQTVKLNYKSKDGQDYILNIIDTPGHVDFGYEVSRSLSACEGSLLIVDSTQGVEAQTLANVYQALEINHEVIPVLNKIDLPASDTEKTKKEIEDVVGIETINAISCSGKTGEGIDDILEAIINKLPAPIGEPNEKLKCLLVDSWYDSYLGVVILVRVINGKLKKGMNKKNRKYDAILIDEAQDFEFEWFEFIKLFLNNNKEMLIVRDLKQNLYGRKKDSLRGVGSGRWGVLKKGYRLLNDHVEMINNFSINLYFYILFKTPMVLIRRFRYNKSGDTL